MRYVKMVNMTRERTLAERARVAETPFSRRRGLLGTEGLSDREGLLIVPCHQVHTIGMRYPIDVVFVDEAFMVIKVVRDLKPGRLSPFVWRARAALELPAGRAAMTGTKEGDLLDALPSA